MKGKSELPREKNDMIGIQRQWQTESTEKLIAIQKTEHAAITIIAVIINEIYRSLVDQTRGQTEVLRSFTDVGGTVAQNEV